MLGMLYIAITALLMLGAVFDREGLAGLIVVVLVVLWSAWLIVSGRGARANRQRR